MSAQSEIDHDFVRADFDQIDFQACFVSLHDVLYQHGEFSVRRGIFGLLIRPGRNGDGARESDERWEKPVHGREFMRAAL